MVVVHRRHARVVVVAQAVPDAVFLIDAHVAHLHGQEVLQNRLPHAAVVHIRRDAEDARRALAVAHAVQALLAHIAEVCLEVVVAQEAAPFGRLQHLNRLLALLGDAGEHHGLARRIAPVQLDDGRLGLVALIPHLRHLHHGLVQPVLDHVGRDDPPDRALDRALRDLGGEHEPAVVVVHAPVVQLEVRSLALHGKAAGRIVGPHGKAPSHRVGRGDEVVCDHGGVARLVVARELPAVRAAVDLGQVAGVVVVGGLLQRRAVGLAGEDALLAVHDPRLAEQVAGEQLQVEAQLARVFRRDGLA